MGVMVMRWRVYEEDWRTAGNDLFLFLLGRLQWEFRHSFYSKFRMFYLALLNLSRMSEEMTFSKIYVFLQLQQGPGQSKTLAKSHTRTHDMP